MKYKEVYLALNQRKLDAPGFHYSDYSGWEGCQSVLYDPPAPPLDCGRRPGCWQTDVDLPRRLCVECHHLQNEFRRA